MKITILTNEYPPNIYGGAGVHVEYLTRELAQVENGAHQVQVLCFGEQRAESGNIVVHGVEAGTHVSAADPRHEKFFDTLLRDLRMAGAVEGADVVHCHTWYSHFAGCLVRQLTGARLILTTHSLEPHRPWKVEQLGTAYHASRWIEQTAYQNADGVVAVSRSMQRDVLDLYDVDPARVRIIHNGIDIEEYRPTPAPQVLRQHAIDPDVPFVLFVGRITRQKGIVHLVNALKHLDDGMQVVLCAGAPDTPEIAREMQEAVDQARSTSTNPIIWISEMLPRSDVIGLYSEAAVFVCPSVYEPFGIINLEAMACETPVVASEIGGIPEVVVPEETGLLVPLEARADAAEPVDPERFARDLASGINRLIADPGLRARMSKKARRRVEEHFSWRRIAERTVSFYRDVLND